MADKDDLGAGKIKLTTKGGFSVDPKVTSFLAENSITLQNKLEPLFASQTDLSKSVSALNQGYLESVFEPTRKVMSVINNTMAPMLESVRVVNESITNIGRVTLDANLLSTSASYDFLNNPLGATLTTAMDAVKISQDRLNTSLASIQDNFTIPLIHTGNQIKNIGILGNMSLDTLQSSVTLFPDRKEQRLEELDDKVAVLEIKIKTLTQEKNSLIFSDITKEVSDELGKIDSELAKCFRGAIRTLVEDKSEDLVAQVAESLTRVVENLPFRLAKKSTTFTEKKTSAMIADAMKEYLGLPDQPEYKNHPLIVQQNNFYITLSGIRHRDKYTYPMFNKDRKRFRALVISFEAYIYLLLTFRGKDD